MKCSKIWIDRAAEEENIQGCFLHPHDVSQMHGRLLLCIPTLIFRGGFSHQGGHERRRNNGFLSWIPSCVLLFSIDYSCLSSSSFMLGSGIPHHPSSDGAVSFSSEK
jgi:hypothetical protein